MSRYFLRCRDCLTVSAVECDALPRVMECGACGGALESMGKVSGLYLTHTHLGCPCDERCTGARGPKCDCSCGGENHGSNLLVEFVTVAGAIPRLTPARGVEKALAVAEEWRAALSEAQARVRDSVPGRAAIDKAAGNYLTGSRWDDYLTHERARKMLRDAKAGRTHAGRLNRLAAAVAICERAAVCS